MACRYYGKAGNANCPKIFIVNKKMIGDIAEVMESWIGTIWYR